MTRLWHGDETPLWNSKNGKAWGTLLVLCLYPTRNCSKGRFQGCSEEFLPWNISGSAAIYCLLRSTLGFWHQGLFLACFCRHEVFCQNWELLVFVCSITLFVSLHFYLQCHILPSFLGVFLKLSKFFTALQYTLDKLVCSGWWSFFSRSWKTSGLDFTTSQFLNGIQSVLLPQCAG